MDLQRLLILLGLGVTTYLLILAWNEDYGQGRQLADDSPETSGELVAGGEFAGGLGDSNLGDPSLGNAGISSLPDLGEAPRGALRGTVPEWEDPSPVPEASQKEALSEARLLRVTTDVFDIAIDLYGGDIVRVALPQFPKTMENPEVPFLLIDPRNAYAAQSGLIGPNGTDQAATRPRFTAPRSTYEMGDADSLRVSLSHTQPDATEIVKNFYFQRGEYLLRVDYEINNRSNSTWQGALFTQIKRDSQKPVTSDGGFMGLQPFVGGATRSVDDPYTKLEFEDIAEESYKAHVEAGYMAMVQHYFVGAWVPEKQAGNTYQARKLSGRDVYFFGITSPLISIAPGSTDTLSALFYAGPKDQYKLAEIAEGLNLTLDYGFLWWLAQPLFYMLTFFHGLVGNWGFAIILLTIVVKAILYPLSAASFRSMAKMRKLQPEMQRLKERHEGDAQKRTQEMMGLYKKEGVNPLGGCLPILLQMPVFLALYWALMESVELRQAPFIFWVKDLSAMDPYFVLPILMGISMFLTQRLNPEPPDPIQARVFKLMPIMFTFFFLWFPSGLVLYWLVNNLLTFAQQYYVTART